MFLEYGADQLEDPPGGLKPHNGVHNVYTSEYTEYMYYIQN